MSIRYSAILCAALASTLPLAPQGASAQSSGDDFVALLEALARSTTPPKNVTMQGIGSGSVAAGGSVFGSVSGTTKRAGGGGIDGSLSFGAGFGDASAGVGAQVSVNITSADPADFADSGFLGVKFGTKLGGERPTFVALSLDNLAGWGDSAGNDLKATAAVTTFGEVSLGGDAYPTMFTLGLQGTEGGDVSPFAGLGVGITEHVGASVSHDGSNVNLGLGFKVPGVDGMSASVTLDDAFEQDGDRRATFSLSYSVADWF